MRRANSVRGGARTVLKAKCAAPKVTDATFKKEVVESSKPVLVFFAAPW